MSFIKFKIFLTILYLNSSNGSVISLNCKLFPVSIIHINDFHARFEQTNNVSSPCNPNEKCIGGYARLVTVVKSLFKKHKNTNPIYLNAGDNFQGTLWYNIGRWNVTSHLLNLLPADAMTLGNHEFDDGIEGVVPYLETIHSPVVVSNIDDSEEPDIQGKYNKSVIIERNNRKIGIIGVITQKTYEISTTGKLKFLNETESVRKEAEKLTEKGVDIVIVLSHCGLDVDRIIAKNAGPNIDVIVGGHSHTFLYSGNNPPGPDKPQGPYPVEVIQEHTGHRVLIVQASAYAKYVGDLTVYFDEYGEIVVYEGAPIFLDTSVPRDKSILKALKPWKETIDAKGKVKIGSTKVLLSKAECNSGECNIGNFIADSFVYEAASKSKIGEYWTPAAISLISVGGIRTSINPGDVTYAHLITTIPFENRLFTLDIQGKHILEALEYSVIGSEETKKFYGRNMLQHSGLKVTFNTTKPIGQRVIEVHVRCQKCILPKYMPLDIKETYRIIVQEFLANGGDGFTMIRDNKKNVLIGRKDIDVLIDFVKKRSPVIAGIEGRKTMYT